MKPIILLSSMLLIRSISMAQVTGFEIDDSKFDKHIVLVLDSIYKDDQDGRFELLALTRNEAPVAKTDSLRKVIHEKDLKNIVKVNNIIAQYGWLGPQKVGMKGSQALFLVIQHADLATQERYLPMIRKAEKDGETLSSNLAIFEDRVAMREGKKQIYGSQGFTDKATGKKYVYPIIDPDHLDERRKAMGMPPMSDYMKMSNSTWDLEAYKKMLPEIEKAAKEQQ
jgi:hypothetical protein